MAAIPMATLICLFMLHRFHSMQEGNSIVSRL